MNKIILGLFFLACAHLINASENLLLQINGGYKSLATCGFLGEDIAVPTDDNALTVYNLDGSIKKRITGHASIVSAYDQSRSGDHFATGSFDNVINQFDGAGSMTNRYFDAKDAISTVRFSGDEATLMVHSWDNSISGRNPRTGDRRYYIKDQEQIITCAPNYDGYNIAVSKKGKSAAELWQISKDSYPEMYLRLIGHQADIFAVDWHPDNLTLSTGSADSTVKIWNSETGQAISTLGGFRGTRAPVRYNPTGTLLAVGSRQYEGIVVYDVNTARVAFELAGHAGGTDDLKWSLDGKYIVSCSDRDKLVKVWSLESRWAMIVKKCQKLLCCEQKE